jgi:hypothetical protein
MSFIFISIKGSTTCQKNIKQDKKLNTLSFEQEIEINYRFVRGEIDSNSAYEDKFPRKCESFILH